MTCQHFTVLAAERCAAGVVYAQIRAGNAEDGYTLPCFREDNCPTPCAFVTFPPLTPEAELPFLEPWEMTESEFARWWCEQAAKRQIARLEGYPLSWGYGADWERIRIMEKADMCRKRGRNPQAFERNTSIQAAWQRIVTEALSEGRPVPAHVRVKLDEHRARIAARMREDFPDE